MAPSSRPPIIIDVEASGFGPRSYPIEVGVALHTGVKHCWLIRPQAAWTHWDPQAQDVHRVSRDLLLTHGKPAVEVASRLNELLRERTAYSDGWVVDQTWLNQLFHAAALPCAFSLSALELILTEPQMAIWHPTKDALMHELGGPRHRASFDAFLVQQTWERTWEATRSASGGRIP